MKKYENIYIYTDVDGTISTWKYEIPKENIEALRYFTENGGHFGLSTGRGWDGISSLPVVPFINMPCILGNGAACCNVNDDTPVYAKFLPPSARDLAMEIRDRFPTVAVYSWGIRHRFDMSDREFCKREDAFSFTIKRSIEEVTEPWTRLVIYTEEEDKEEMTEYIRKHSKGEMEVTTSGKRCIGLMAKGVNKGIALKEMADKFSLDRKNLYVCGDFDNDIPMLTLENVNSFCPSSAESKVKSICTKVLCPVEEGILKEVLTEIDKNIK